MVVPLYQARRGNRASPPRAWFPRPVDSGTPQTLRDIGGLNNKLVIPPSFRFPPLREGNQAARGSPYAVGGTLRRGFVQLAPDSSAALVPIWSTIYSGPISRLGLPLSEFPISMIVDSNLGYNTPSQRTVASLIVFLPSMPVLKIPFTATRSPRSRGRAGAET